MSAVMTADRELTAEEVAKRLKVSRMTITRRIQKGRIRARFEGGQWHILESDLQKYIESTYNRPKQEDD